MVILGFSTVLPINLGKPNFFGSYTLCSFVPIATVAMFILALTIYSFFNKRKLLLYGNMFLLLVILGFTGFWIYDAKLPMDSLEIGICNVHFWTGYDSLYEIWGGNVSRIDFNLTIHNPTTRDTLSLRWESEADFYIEGKKLERHTYDLPNYWPGVIKAGGTKNMDLHVTVIYNYTRIEGDTLENVWMALMRKSFTFTLSGILISTRYYGPEYNDYIVWASKPFSISYTYQE